MKIRAMSLLCGITIIVQVLVCCVIPREAGAAGYDMIVANDGSGNYTTVQAAINKVADNSQAVTTIYIKNGRYKEKINIPSSKKNIFLTGQSTSGTILTYDNCANTPVSGGGTMGTTGSASVTVSGSGFHAENITFENSYDEAANGASQAVAMLAKADRMIFKNCAFKGNQDTLYANGKACRQYFYNCYIEGDVDFIFGAANAVFDDCEIFTVNRNGGYIAAPSTPPNEKGYLFYNCRLTSNCRPKTIALGRPWVPSSNTDATPKVLYRECQLGQHITDAGWSSMSGNNPANYEMWEYHNTGAGANSSRKQLPSSKAAGYTREAFLSGSDGWNPMQAAPSFTYGDVNGDGIVNTIDYSIVRSYILQRIDTMPSVYWKEAGDLNLDGTINSMDYLYLKMYILEMIDMLPIKAGA